MEKLKNPRWDTARFKAVVYIKRVGGRDELATSAVEHLPAFLTQAVLSFATKDRVPAYSPPLLRDKAC